MTGLRDLPLLEPGEFIGNSGTLGLCGGVPGAGTAGAAAAANTGGDKVHNR